MFDFEQMQEISGFARENKIKMHQIHIPDGDEKTGKVFIKINPSILRRSPEELVEVFNSLTLC